MLMAIPTVCKAVYQRTSGIVSLPCGKSFNFSCRIVTKNYQHVLALAFAVKEINGNPHILPNTTLGFHIFESYFSPKRIYHIVMEFFSTHHRFVPNYKCGIYNNLIGVIGGLAFLSFYQIPGSTNFLSLYQMLPNKIHQYRGIVQLLLHFRWLWVGLMTMDDDNAEMFLKTILPELHQNGICPAFTKKMFKITFFDDFIAVQENFNRTFGEVMNSDANVIIIHGDTGTMLNLRMLLNQGKTDHEKIFYKVWVMTVQLDLVALSMHKDWNIEVFHGALAFTIHSHEVPSFHNFIQTLTPHLAKGDGFIHTFWEQVFGCSFSNSNLEEEDISLWQSSLSPSRILVLKFIFLKLLLLNYLFIPFFPSSELHAILRNFSFNNSAGETIFLNENGEFTMEFDITNVITFSNNSYARVKVGRMNPWALPEKKFLIDDDAIIWSQRFNQVVPISLCNNICNPGYQKKKKEGKPFCCYDCVPCAKGKVSYLTGTFVKHHNTPIVKANNRDLTYTLLISLLLCFLFVLLFIGRPQKVTCFIRQMAFSITFSVAVSCVLAKTIAVVLAFMATRPGSNMRKWLGKRLTTSMVLFCSHVQAGICAAWLATSPPFPDIDMATMPEEIVLECNEGSITMFYCALGYIGFLAFLSFTVAFFARKLPDSFNEAKFITFSMLVFCAVWLSFLPTYQSTKGKYMVAVEIFSILASSAGLLGCIFFPKCYIIILRPELNKKENLMKRKT
uniref:G-protein coupled receptors family 3 profile domain-containing protein n=1 Tax=Varanus komodoensis TaxID=61221 RepID=A0A8D2IMW7_VARKO